MSDGLGLGISASNYLSCLCSPGPLISDSFVRANNSVIGPSDGLVGGQSLGAVTPTEVGDWNILTNRCEKLGVGDKWATWETSKNSVILESDAWSTTANVQVGLVLRYIDDTHFWKGIFHGAAVDEIQIWEYDGGAAVERASVAFDSSIGQWYKMKFEVNNANLFTLTIDVGEAGETSCNYTSSVNAAGTQHGYFGFVQTFFKDLVISPN